MTEVTVATHGATVGKPIEDAVWTVHKLPQQGINNIGDMLKDTVPDRTSSMALSPSIHRANRTQRCTSEAMTGKGLAQWES